MGTGVITLCNKYVKNTIIPLNICLFFYHWNAYVLFYCRL
jgi:hypothetical protein